MIKDQLDTPSYERVFIRNALSEGLRLDGRKLSDCREVSIKLSRGEQSSYSEVTFGRTRVTCSAIGSIVAPYADRPAEGMLNFLVDISPATEKAGVSKTDLIRHLERSIRDSDSLDTESLCIISGESVWSIRCDVRVLDYQGNALDGVCLATMSALRAFRKPEVSLERLPTVGGEERERKREMEREREREMGNIPAMTRTRTMELRVYSCEEREPLPLALHHTPLTISLSIFKDIALPVQSEEEEAGVEDVLVVDACKEEDQACDGTLLLSINAHRELCALSKPGGVAVSVQVILRASAIAVIRATALHTQLTAALKELEKEVAEKREKRLRDVQEYRARQMHPAVLGSMSQERNGAEVVDMETTEGIEVGVYNDSVPENSIVIEKNDPIL
eukprot:CAMPEP_0182418828 /NCGR_PEP_ID=MMETSP1167-20130531/3212_1 /TAXON_ID=2988 /ORGANISM="Mallomonas Sp, Strain CCMP3275" /LENGTH=390 /DNA_ID=CAMNT_0024593257 /DNA_START=33 /DNA_END=1202 /DNA_ORIENTATION=-